MDPIWASHFLTPVRQQLLGRLFEYPYVLPGWDDRYLQPLRSGASDMAWSYVISQWPVPTRGVIVEARDESLSMCFLVRVPKSFCTMSVLHDVSL